MQARELLVAVGAVAGIIAGTLLVALGVARPHGEQLAAVFPPWWTPARSFVAAASAGSLVAQGHVPGAVIVRGDAASLAGRLRAAGALLVLDPTFSAGCEAAVTEIAR